jgi:tetratricopeptide (TPR) repeat protein
MDIRADQIAKQVWVNPTPTQSSSEEEIYNLLAEADQNLQYGNPQAAIDMILPVIETWPSEIDRATGYQLLSVAEGRLSHEKKAVVYAEKMVENSPGSFTYQMLGTAYEVKGDLENALEAYTMATTFDDDDFRFDLEYVNARIDILSEALGIDTH